MNFIHLLVFLVIILQFSFKEEQVHNHPAYVYYFRHPLPGDDAGAFHSAELWYMFGTLDRCWRPMTEVDRTLSDRMLRYWTNFMKSGNPNIGDEKEVHETTWNLCRGNDPFVKIFA